MEAKAYRGHLHWIKALWITLLCVAAFNFIIAIYLRSPFVFVDAVVFAVTAFYVSEQKTWAGILAMVWFFLAKLFMLQMVFSNPATFVVTAWVSLALIRGTIALKAVNKAPLIVAEEAPIQEIFEFDENDND